MFFFSKDLNKLDNTDSDSCFNSLYGYVYFRQQKDPANPRGFSQKSFVILSALPLCYFFKNILDVLSSHYFDQENDSENEQLLKVIFF